MSSDIRDDWAEWQRDWRAAGGAASSQAAADASLAKARIALILTPLVEAGLAGGALAVTGLALYHAAAAFELAIGFVVAASIAILWSRRVASRRNEHAAAAAGSVDYLTFLRSVRAQQVRLARFVWIVLSLELAFLTPWWIRGSRIHPRTITSVSAWMTMYLPIVIIIALYVWAERMRRAAVADAAQLDHAIEEFTAHS
jgi:hypothetical protein